MTLCRPRIAQEGARDFSRQGHATAAANAGGADKLGQMGRKALVEKYGEVRARLQVPWVLLLPFRIAASP